MGKCGNYDLNTNNDALSSSNCKLPAATVTEASCTSADLFTW